MTMQTASIQTRISPLEELHAHASGSNLLSLLTQGKARLLDGRSGSVSISRNCSNSTINQIGFRG